MHRRDGICSELESGYTVHATTRESMYIAGKLLAIVNFLELPGASLQAQGVGKRVMLSWAVPLHSARECNTRLQAAGFVLCANALRLHFATRAHKRRPGLLLHGCSIVHKFYEANSTRDNGRSVSPKRSIHRTA